MEEFKIPGGSARHTAYCKTEKALLLQASDAWLCELWKPVVCCYISKILLGNHKDINSDAELIPSEWVLK